MVTTTLGQIDECKETVIYVFWILDEIQPCLLGKLLGRWLVPQLSQLCVIVCTKNKTPNGPEKDHSTTDLLSAAPSRLL